MAIAKKVLPISITVLSNYFVLIGASSYYFDHRLVIQRQSTFSKYYAIVVNVLIVSILPLIFSFTFRYLNDFELNQLMILSNRVNITLRFAVLLYTICMRWKRESPLRHINDELMNETEFLKQLNNMSLDIEPRLRKLLYCNLGVFLYFNVNMLWYRLQLDLTLLDDLKTVLLKVVLNILTCTILQYFLSLWWICRGFNFLNSKLHQLMSDSHLGCSPEFLKQLLDVRRIHWRLNCIVGQLNKIYQFQLIAHLFTSVTYNVVSGYYIFKLVSLREKKLWLSILGVSTYAVSFLELYLLEVMCDYVADASRETTQILRQFQIRPHKEIDRYCEKFALPLTSLDAGINVFGMFEINKRSWFYMVTAILGYIILPVQFDIALREKAFGI